MNTTTYKRNQKLFKPGTYLAHFICTVPAKNGTYRLKFLVFNEEEKQTENFATNFTYNKPFEEHFGISEFEMRNLPYVVDLGLNEWKLKQGVKQNTILKCTPKKWSISDYPWIKIYMDGWEGDHNSPIKKAYLKEREEKDPKFRRTTQARRLVNLAIKDQLQPQQYIFFGCDRKTLMEHLEAQMKTKGYTWEDHKLNGNKAFHIDHIRPLTKFNLLDNEEFLQATHYTNLQIISAEENITKLDGTWDFEF